MTKLSWNEQVCLVRVRAAERGRTADRQLVAEGTLLAVCQLILIMSAAQKEALAIHFPDRRAEPLRHGSSDFSLMLSNAKAEVERRRIAPPEKRQASSRD